MGFKVIDNFLTDFAAMREHCDTVSYDGVDNPADGVFYPGVSVDIPESVQDEVVYNLTDFMGRKVTLNFMFLRLSSQFVEAPHQAHTDALMGKYSLMLYLNSLEDCEGGTSFLVHKNTLMDSSPVNDKQLKVWEQDTNNQGKWAIKDYCQMMPNRGLIFDANLMHRAEPIGGFGTDAVNGRLVLTAFYD